jgi:hypothetical protein
MKNSNYTIGKQTRDLPTYKAVHQPTALPRAPPTWLDCVFIHLACRKIELFHGRLPEGDASCVETRRSS